MKKSILIMISLLFALATTSIAQTEKGNILLGTTVDMTGGAYGDFIGTQLNGAGFLIGTNTYKYGENEEKINITKLNFSPQIGYFFADGLVGGANVRFVYLSTKEDGASDNNAFTSVSAGPFVRYYFSGEKVQPYLHASASLGTASFKDSDNSMETLRYQAGAGLAVSFNDHISFDILAGYNYLNSTDEDGKFSDKDDVFRSFGLDLGVTFIIGSNSQ